MRSEISRRALLASGAALPLAGAATFETRLLGRSGLAVTKLGMGCEDTRDPEVLRRAVELGINYFNCFPPRGDVGPLSATARALKPFRSRIVLSTGTNERTPDGILADLECLLTAFETDCIDLFYLTSRNKPEELSDEVLAALEKARRQGKIRAAAVSTHALPAIAPRLLEVCDVIHAVMVTCNFAVWQGFGSSVPGLPEPAPGSIAQTAIRMHESGIGLVAMKPMLGGLGFVPSTHKDWAAAQETDAKRDTALGAALRWVLANQYIDTIPVQTNTVKQVEANVRSARTSFSERDARILALELDRIGRHYCRMCGSCAGACPADLPVADMLRFLLYADGYGNRARAQAAFRTLPERLQSIRCDACQTCSVTCPNGVAVQQQLIRAQRLMA